MLFLNGIYIDGIKRSPARFREFNAPTSDEFTALAPYHFFTYRIAVGPQQSRKVFTLKTLPACESDYPFEIEVGKVAVFSLHTGVAAKAHECKKQERLCRYISRPAVWLFGGGMLGLISVACRKAG